MYFYCFQFMNEAYHFELMNKINGVHPWGELNLLTKEEIGQEMGGN